MGQQPAAAAEPDGRRAALAGWFIISLGCLILA